ncbi:MAG: hypothetical protein RSD57_02265 [Comamonas sp.]
MQVLGYEAEDAGTVQFTSTYVGATITRPSSVQFPHEEAKPMQRLVLEGENWQEHMLGTWLFTWISSDINDTPHFVNLTTILDGSVISDDGTVKCQLEDSATPRVRCSWSKAAGSVVHAPAGWVSSPPFASTMQAIRLADKYGNAAGLGALD